MFRIFSSTTSSGLFDDDGFTYQKDPKKNSFVLKFSEESEGEAFKAGPLLKILLVGDSKVGKTSIMNRFISDQNPLSKSIPTSSLDFKLNFAILRDGTYVRLQLMDTPGLEKYRAIARAHYKLTDAVIFVYDVSSKVSYKNIDSIWIPEVKKQTDRKIYSVVCGNKCDIEGKNDDDDEYGINQSSGIKENGFQVITKEDCQDFDTSITYGDNGYKHIRCSSLTGTNINEMMEYLVMQHVTHCSKK